jgi:hypothetical protein
MPWYQLKEMKNSRTTKFPILTKQLNEIFRDRISGNQQIWDQRLKDQQAEEHDNVLVINKDPQEQHSKRNTGRNIPVDFLINYVVETFGKQ